MEDDTASVSLLQWLGTWVLTAGARCTPLWSEHGGKPRDNGKGEDTHGE